MAAACAQAEEDEDEAPYELPWLRRLLIFGTNPPALTRKQWLVMGLLTACGLFKSYDSIIVNLVLPQLQRDLHISDRGVSFLGAFLSLSGVFGLPLLVLADIYGRRAVLLFTILPYSILTGLTAFSQSWAQFAACQFCAGIFLSGEHLVSQVVIIEEMPSHCRGWAVGVLAAASAFGGGIGILLFGFIGDNHGGWRWLYGLAVLPLLCLAQVRRRLPETSRFQAQSRGEVFAEGTPASHASHACGETEDAEVSLANGGFDPQAEMVGKTTIELQGLRGAREDLSEVQDWPHAADLRERRSWCCAVPKGLKPLHHLFQESRPQAWSVLTLVAVERLANAAGELYSFKYLQQAHGLAAKDVSALGILGGLLALGAYTIAGELSDRWGRRRLTCGFYIVYAFLGAGYFLVPPGEWTSWVVRFLWIMKVACGMALATLVTAMVVEIFPTSHRATAQSLGPMAVSVANPLGILMEGLLAQSLGYEDVTGSQHWRATAMLVSLTFLCAVIVRWRFPETAGCSLEEIRVKKKDHMVGSAES